MQHKSNAACGSDILEPDGSDRLCADQRETKQSCQQKISQSCKPDRMSSPGLFPFSLGPWQYAENVFAYCPII